MNLRYVSYLSMFPIMILTIFGGSIQDVFAQIEFDPVESDEEIPQENSPILDTTPPELSIPDDIVISPDNELGAVVIFSVSAVDDVDGQIIPICSPSSGSFFHMDSTIVTCTATDSSGNISDATFVVNIQDQIPPVLTVPEDILIDTTVVSGTRVTFTVSAVDDINGLIIPICTSESGSVFPIGNTIVTCTAIDSSGNISDATFVVTINNLITILNEELTSLEELEPNEIGNVGDHVSEFIKISNTLSQLEKQEIRNIQSEFQQEIKNADKSVRDEIRSKYNSELSEFRKKTKDLRSEFHDIFKEYRTEIKQLSKEAKALSVEDKRQLLQLHKIKLKIEREETKSSDKIDSVIYQSLNKELKDKDKKLHKLHQLIALSELPRTVIFDKNGDWKQQRDELKNTVKLLKKTIKESEKDSKKEIKSLIKEFKKLDKDNKDNKDKKDKKDNKDNKDNKDRKDRKDKKKKDKKK